MFFPLKLQSIVNMLLPKILSLTHKVHTRTCKHKCASTGGEMARPCPLPLSASCWGWQGPGTRRLACQMFKAPAWRHTACNPVFSWGPLLADTCYRQLPTLLPHGHHSYDVEDQAGGKGCVGDDENDKDDDKETLYTVCLTLLEIRGHDNI